MDLRSQSVNLNMVVPSSREQQSEEEEVVDGLVWREVSISFVDSTQLDRLFRRPSGRCL